MIALYILAALVLLLLALLLLRIRVVFHYEKELRVYLRILFLKIPLHPQKKRVRAGAYTYRRHRRRLKKQRKKSRRRASRTVERAASAPKKKPPLTQRLSSYFSLFRYLYRRSLRYFRLDLNRLHITVATGDAAKTAVAYGIVSQGVAYLLKFLSLHTKFHRTYRADVRVEADFIGTKTKADCRISFSMRVYEILDLGVRFFFRFLKSKLKKP